MPTACRVRDVLRHSRIDQDGARRMFGNVAAGFWLLQSIAARR